MADKKISALTGATTPLAGTEVLPIVQGGATVKVAVSDLTAGRAVNASSLTASSLTSGRIPYAGTAGLLQDSTKLKFDGTNFGLNATISAWATVNAVQVNNGAIFNAGDDLNFTSNAYYDGTNYRYMDAFAFPNFYSMYNGVHTWKVSSSSQGANNIITWDTAMTVDRSSNLTITGSTATKASGTTWANPSDVRLKINVKNYEKGLFELLQLRFVTGEYNGLGGTPKGIKFISVIAQEAQQILPDSISTFNAKLNLNDEKETEFLKYDSSETQVLVAVSVQQLAKLIEAQQLQINKIIAKLNS